MTSDGSSGATFRRADGRRNRAALVEAARDTFLESGVDAPLDVVAKRAHVGNATLYRHFPTRSDLIAAVVENLHRSFAGWAALQCPGVSPGDALREWLRKFTECTGSLLGLPEAIRAAMEDATSALHDSCVAMKTEAARLLSRAQEAGEIRPDVGVEVVLAHAMGTAWARLGASSTETKERMMALFLDGLASSRARAGLRS